MTGQAERYAWVAKGPQRRPLPPDSPRRPGLRRGLVFIDGPCEVCGWSPVGWRKVCAACLAVVSR
jgi:hypothetical protein